MKISTRGRYGLRALADLANHNGEGAIPLREIAERQQISEQYLEQLFVRLRNGKFVKSVRGPHGGYKLGRPPSEIVIGDVIRVLEGPIAPVDCVEEGNSCKLEPACVTHDLWEELQQRIADFFDSMTLQDLLSREQEKLKNLQGV